MSPNVSEECTPLTASTNKTGVSYGTGADENDGVPDDGRSLRDILLRAPSDLTGSVKCFINHHTGEQMVCGIGLRGLSETNQSIMS